MSTGSDCALFILESSEPTKEDSKQKTCLPDLKNEY